ncbi:transposase [Desulfobotulus mexicanus]|uniref:Transposase DDE domain-containing protein n=1 Tax=Desulfobotulus mexicanus TaxID=2586642 RepID=A0A5S5ME29_9BACT|nr:transposase [Desulfobotulus mexicanus]TYT73964.1 hypothetical protein FIM25_12445 [Desulfobotulus mexicanus]
MEEEKEYPFPTTIMDGKNYKIFGIVTNMDWEGEKLIQWLYKRCGESEEIHRAMKEDFAGGRLPSSNLGENAAWWWIMILSMNLHVAMKKLALGENWLTKKMKIIRFNLIHIPAHVYEKASALIIRCKRSVGWMMEIRKRLSLLKA